VLARNVHRGESWTAAGRSRSRGGSNRGAVGSTIDTVRGDGSGLLVPGGRNRSLTTGLRRAKGWESLLGGRVQGRLLERRGVVGLLLASGLLAQRRIGSFGGGRRMGDVFLVRDVLNSDVVLVLLHQLLRRGKPRRGRAGSGFGCHIQCKPFRGDQRVLRRRREREVRFAEPLQLLRRTRLSLDVVGLPDTRVSGCNGSESEERTRASTVALELPTEIQWAGACQGTVDQGLETVLGIQQVCGC
jgi:hypothetical protein